MAADGAFAYPGLFGMSSMRPFLRQLWQRILDDDLLNRANELAYSFLLALFPLLLFFVSLFGFFASQAVTLRHHLFGYLSDALPPVAYDLVRRTLDEVMTRAGGGKLTLGLLLALYWGSGGMTQLISTLNVTYAVRERRSWFKVHAISFLLTAGMAFSTLTVLFLIIAGNTLLLFVQQRFGENLAFVIVWYVIEWTVAVSLVVAILSFIYYFGPDVKHRHWITPGCVVAVFLWILASAGLRLYLHFFNNYSRVYGSLGAVIVLLLWFYLSGLASLIGGEINSILRRSRPQEAPI